ncbi:MAG: histidine phosphatase family protein [Planctomycetota bacterium]
MRPVRTALRAVLACALIGSVAALAWQSTPRATAPAARTVVLVRHAEKDPAGDPRDPSLSEAGRGRAAALAHALSRAGVTHLLATEYHRTQETLAPLALKTGLTVQAIPAASVDAWTKALDALPAGSVAVVAGHSNTVPALAQALGGTLAGLTSTTRGPQLREDEFDRLIVITQPGSGCATTTLELSYAP